MNANDIKYLKSRANEHMQSNPFHRITVTTHRLDSCFTGDAYSRI
jgi:hypothetical protein